MRLVDRVSRHARITWQGYRPVSTPAFLILFVNSVCNMRCEHCFYWRNLNGKDDLSMEELLALSRSMGHIENLSLSGGEPFLRPQLHTLCSQFIRHNGVRQIYVPTNGYFSERTVTEVTEILKESGLDLFVVELSLDGTAGFHDQFRGTPGAFERAMETYDALAEMQRRDPRLRIHAASTATNVNVAEIRDLTTLLYERCPQMDHHNLAIIRGDSKNPSLLVPSMDAYQGLYEYIRNLWLPRETGRYGAIVEPMLQWAKYQTLNKDRQVFPCTAGRLSGVVYANGDVSACELHPPLGNLRQASFPVIWSSPEATRLLQSIAQGSCHCTTEVFLWPSIVYRPLALVQAMIGARVWRKPRAQEVADPVVSRARGTLPSPVAEPAAGSDRSKQES